MKKITGATNGAILMTVDGRTIRPLKPPLERLWAKVQVDESGCWLWTGSKNSAGYGYIAIRRDFKVYAHRFAYEAVNGPIPEGLQMDHLCRTPSCVNPWHLEAVTPLVNTQRGLNHHRNKTHCPSGHPYDEANTLHSSGRRYCRACQNERNKKRYEK